MFSELNVIRGAFRLGFLRVGADNRAWRGAEPIELPKKSSSIQIVTTWTVPLKFYMLQSSNVDQSSESLHSDKKRPQSGAAFFPSSPFGFTAVYHSAWPPSWNLDLAAPPRGESSSSSPPSSVFHSRCCLVVLSVGVYSGCQTFQHQFPYFVRPRL